MPVLSRVRAAGALAPIALSALLGACGSEPGADPVPGADVALPGPGDDVGNDIGGGDDTAAPARPPTCAEDDRFSPNATPGDAAVLPVAAGRPLQLHLCAGSTDWFAWELNGPTQLRWRVEQGEGLADALQVQAVDGAGAPLTVVRLPVEEGVSARTWEVRVEGAGQVRLGLSLADGGARAFDYRATWRVLCADSESCGADGVCSLVQGGCIEALEPLCGDDDQEPNNDPGTAVRLLLEGASGQFRFEGLVVCEEDDDLFVLELTEPATVEGLVVYDEGNDLSVRLYDARGVLFDRAASVDEVQVPFVFAQLPAGRWYMVVTDEVRSLGLDVRYTLEGTVRPAGCRTNDDCVGVPGRLLCGDGGGCLSFEPEVPGGPNDPCDDSSDCGDDLGCYASEGRLDANRCTRNCRFNDDCGDFPQGYCLDYFGTGFCASACTLSADCPAFLACDAAAGRCVVQGCGTDADCTGDAICRRTRDNQGVCQKADALPCATEDRFEPNNSTGQAALLEGSAVRDLTICDADEDWFVLEVLEDNAELSVSLSWDTGADLDLYVYDERGRPIASSTSPEGNPEVAVGRRLPAGRYLVRVDQFPRAEVGNAQTTYDLSWSVGEEADACSAERNPCLELQPVRIDCLGTGACGFFEGNGEVPLGGACDSTDDCTEDARFCWTFSGAARGQNICTKTCATDAECEDVPGTRCRVFGRGSRSACAEGAEGGSLRAGVWCHGWGG
jgi:hypothetical protein